MTDDAFDRVFGGGNRGRPTFSERVTHGEPQGPRTDPRAAMEMEAATLGPTPGEYRAFGFVPSGNVNLSCEVRWWLEGTTVAEGVAFPYRLLMQVGFTGEDTLRLSLPDCVIQVTGRGLESLRQALMRQQATFVQQWSSSVWRTRPSLGPIVERVVVVR